MKAATLHRYGGPEVLRIEEHATPIPAADEVLVEIHAATVTTGDWRLRAAAFPVGLKLMGRLFAGIFRPRHRIPGVDFAGVVRAVGAKVTRFAPGDRVFGSNGHGGQAEYLTISETASIAHAPDNLSHAEAATLPFGANTAHHFLVTLGKLRAGQRVLVTGASGGVGYFAVQLAKSLGAHVTAIAGTGNQPFLRSLGADETIDYRAGDVTARRGEFDVIFDAIGTFRFATAKPLLRPGGKLLALNGAWRALLQTSLPRGRSARRILFAVSMPDAESLARVAELAAKGAIAPVIDRRFPLAEIARAHAAVESRHRSGTVVVDVRAPEALSLVA